MRPDIKMALKRSQYCPIGRPYSDPTADTAIALVLKEERECKAETKTTKNTSNKK